MAFGQAMLSVWMGLHPGASAPMPLGAAPWEAGMIVIAKPNGEQRTSDGREDGAVAKRPWGATGGAPWCEIGMEKDFAEGLRWGASDRAVLMFTLAHEAGHCVDGSAYGKGEQADFERESFADAFGACALGIEGLGEEGQSVASSREETLRGRRGRLQAQAIRRALANPMCAPGQGRDGFSKAWAVAGQVQGELFGAPAAIPIQAAR